MNISYIRSLGKKVDIEEIKEISNEVVFQFEDKSSLREKIVKIIMDKYSKEVAFKLNEKPAIGYNIKNIKKEQLLPIIRNFLEHIVNNNQ